jgi:hypothetical protein
VSLLVLWLKHFAIDVNRGIPIGAEM